ncbi:putative PurR-regulated permease PerM [Hasllibacter halocynthiae]|uniref:Putative PurR-regulated permease PerM n=1 Tax=Hasllibacter halocynthiae TaxID=595589 RepID=A0A2T0X6B9_9RHOB|nr:AI-2E family transporter [Hasllibacter halocynthiae]PRY94501.1 putative PurR-regulated permease PerM [Hasllibacter halocynthiae]
MALAPTQQLKYWGVAALLLLVLLWLLGDVLLPFVLGGTIAYFLDPVADRLEKWGLSRALSVAVITVGAILLFVAVVVPTVLTLEDQVRLLFVQGPEWVERLIDPDGPFLTRFPVVAEYSGRIEDAALRVGTALREQGGAIALGLLTAGQGLLGVVLLLVIVPVVTVYMLLDWDRMIASIDALVPRDHQQTIRRLASEVDETLSGFLRGQGTVMLILGAYYAVALALVGLNFGLIIGAFAGLLTFIPYVGAILGGITAIGMALVQFWGDWVWIAVVAGIFASGQFAEGNFLTPKLVGDSVGLHPVWLLLALSAFGAIFGFVGLLAAVPIAAVLGVIIRFLIELYRESRLYTGEPGPPDAPLLHEHAAEKAMDRVEEADTEDGFAPPPDGAR